jgi:hypothetical protein
MKTFYEIDVTIRGSKPLLQHKFNTTVDSSKKKKKVYSAEEDAKNSLIEKDGIVCQPAVQIEGAMIRSAVDFKYEGKKTFKDAVKAGVEVSPEFIPHKIVSWYVDSRPAVINRSRIMKSRPRFDEWELDFQIKIHDDRIEPTTVKEILKNAGDYFGIGDYRPKFGLFEVTKWNVKNG